MKNVKEITVEVKGAEWEKTIDKAFNKKKKDIKLDGFRKGTVSKEVFIKKVGIEALFMDACDIAVQDKYKEALDSVEFDLVCEPNVSIEKIDKDECVIKYTFIGKPEVKLGEYKNLGIKCDKVKVAAEEVEHELEHIKSHMAELVIKENGEVVEGNTAVINFDGVVDGKPLDGGSGENYELEIGSHTFIPGFEEEIVGMKVGEEKKINLTFPDDYVEHLKGKKVTFTVKVNEIKERIEPKIDKDFFEDLGIDGVDSLDKLKAHIKEDITKSKEKEADDKFTDELLRKCIGNMKVDINQEIIDAEVNNMRRQYEQELQMNGVTLSQYLNMTGTPEEVFNNALNERGLARIQTRYLLEVVAEKENIKVSDKDIDAEVKTVAEQYGMSEENLLSAIGGKEMIEYDLRLKAAIEVIKKANKDSKGK